MARQYKLKTFLRRIDDGLLREYLGNKGVPQPLPEKREKEAPADYWERVIRALPQKDADAIEGDFQEVNEMALESGVQALLEIAREHGIDLTGEIGGIEGDHNQAFHCFLKHHEVFEEAATLHWVDELRSKKERLGLKRRSSDQAKARRPHLTEALKAYFEEKDGRGKHCEVDVYATKERVCFVAHPEDYAKTDLHYDGGDKLKRVRRRPCFEVVYSYYPGTGRLELFFAKAGRDREQELMDLFNSVVLEDSQPLPAMQKVYELNKLFDPDFALPTRVEDQVQEVRVRALRFDSKYGNGERVVLEVNKPGGLQPMRDAMKYRGVKAQHFNITQARIYIKFPGKGKKGGVTIQVTSPDKCNLNDSPTHQKAKEYLVYWGLENAPSATKAV